MRPASPCLRCPDRSFACHASCEKYKEYNEKLNYIREQRFKSYGYGVYVPNHRMSDLNKSFNKKMRGGK